MVLYNVGVHLSLNDLSYLSLVWASAVLTYFMQAQPYYTLSHACAAHFSLVALGFLDWYQGTNAMVPIYENSISERELTFYEVILWHHFSPPSTNFQCQVLNTHSERTPGRGLQSHYQVSWYSGQGDKAGSHIHPRLAYYTQKWLQTI